MDDLYTALFILFCARCYQQQMSAILDKDYIYMGNNSNIIEAFLSKFDSFRTVGGFRRVAYRIVPGLEKVRLFLFGCAGSYESRVVWTAIAGIESCFVQC